MTVIERKTPGLFVTGTGTGVGKTLVTAGLVRALRRGGIEAGMMKPFQTGCGPGSHGGLEAPDVAWTARMACLDSRLAYDRDVCPYAFEPACSPHLAAAMAGVRPDLDEIQRAAGRLGRRFEVLIAEGAGGVLVPVSPRETMLDVMRALKWPVLVVARAGLGTINETLLTLQALRRAHLDVHGVVFSESGPGEERFILEDNPRTVRDFGQVAVLASIPRLKGIDAGENRAWDAFDKGFNPPVIDWEIWK